jgi:endoglucanase
MKKILCLLLALATSAGAVEKGEVVLRHDFEGAEPLKAWNAAPGPLLQIVAGQNGHALQSVRADDKAPSTMVQIPVAIEALRGCKIRVEAMVKAENVSPAPNFWNGIKVMLHIKKTAGDDWPQQNLPQGTFDWRKVNYLVRVPDDAKEAQLSLGLEMVTGTAWFDDVKISVVSLPVKRPTTPPAGPKFKGHNLPRLRGAMTGTNITPDDLKVLAEWGANHVRWQLTWGSFPYSPGDDADLPAYEKWLDEALAKFDSLLPTFRELNIKVALDLHTPPGGRTRPALENKIFKEKKWQDAFLATWERLARKYKGEKAIWGYDLVNEPSEGTVGDGCLDWRDLAEETTRRIRAIDPQSVIIIEAAPWGGVQALADFEPLPFERIVYSFHFYDPQEFTHQGVFGKPAGIQYPGEIGGKKWDKEQIRKAMQPVKEWARSYNLHVYVGEFSAIRWAPGETARDYLRDVIDVLEENEWDWAYHAFREWDGWSIEHTTDYNNKERQAWPTERQKLLTGWFEKNKH